MVLYKALNYPETSDTWKWLIWWLYFIYKKVYTLELFFIKASVIYKGRICPMTLNLFIYQSSIIQDTHMHSDACITRSFIFLVFTVYYDYILHTNRSHVPPSPLPKKHPKQPRDDVDVRIKFACPYLEVFLIVTCKCVYICRVGIYGLSLCTGWCLHKCIVFTRGAQLCCWVGSLSLHTSC